MNIAVVTGASSGIGEEILRGLVRERGAFGSPPFAQIWAIARNERRLDELRKELGPERIRIFALDLADPDSLTVIDDALKEEMPTVGLLVNCAGIGRVGPITGQTPGDQRAMITLNCSVPAELTSICLPYIIAAGKDSDKKNGPRILNIASSAAFLPQPGFATYAASKSFLLNFSRAINHELRPYHVSSTTVCPGPVSTDFLVHATGTPSASFSGIKSLFVARPDKIAARSISAARKGRALLVPGLSQKLLHLVSKVLPARFMMFLSSRLAGTKESSSPEFMSSTSVSISTILLPFGGVKTPDNASAEMRKEIAVPPEAITAQDATHRINLRNGNLSSLDSPLSALKYPPGDPIPFTSDQAAAILRAFPGKNSV